MSNFGVNRSGAASGTGVPTGAVPESLFTAKGDLIAGTSAVAGTEAKLAVGANDTRLVADSTQTTGLKYVADTVNAAIAAKGDLLVGTAAKTLAAHTVGTDGYLLTANSGDTDGLRYLAPSQGFSLINGYLDWTVASSALTCAIKGWDGNDPSTTNPVFAVLRDVTSTTGLPVLVKITAANSVVVSSGSTLGTRNGIACRVWAVLFNDAGTYRLGVINCLTTVAGAGAGSDVTVIYPLSGWGIASSTAEGGAGASDSAQTFYTGTAVTSKPYTVLGYATFESGQATAGTWATAASRKQLWGPSIPLPGQSVQVQRTDTGTMATGTTLIPLDNTIPQNTEGDQYMTAPAFSPSSGANIIAISVSSNFTTGVNSVVGFIVRDSTANALGVSRVNTGVAGSQFALHLNKKILAESTSSTTFKFRAGGGDGAGTTTFNGAVASTSHYGGTFNSHIEVTEIMG